jgi:hypothetical protein
MHGAGEQNLAVVGRTTLPPLKEQQGPTSNNASVAQADVEKELAERASRFDLWRDGCIVRGRSFYKKSSGASHQVSVRMQLYVPVEKKSRQVGDRLLRLMPNWLWDWIVGKRNQHFYRAVVLYTLLMICFPVIVSLFFAYFGVDFLARKLKVCRRGYTLHVGWVIRIGGRRRC